MKWKENVFQEDKQTKTAIAGERERRESASNFLLCLECAGCQEGSCYSCPRISVISRLKKKKKKTDYIKNKLGFYFK